MISQRLDCTHTIASQVPARQRVDDDLTQRRSTVLLSSKTSLFRVTMAAELELDLALDGNAVLVEPEEDSPKRMSLKLNAVPAATNADSRHRRAPTMAMAQVPSQQTPPAFHSANGSQLHGTVSAPPLSLSQPAPTDSSKHPPSPPHSASHENKMARLRWDHPINILGRACNNETNVCPRCARGIYRFHRLLPCSHIFCSDCCLESQKQKHCLKCFEDIGSVTTATLLADVASAPTVHPFSPPKVSCSVDTCCAPARAQPCCAGVVGD